MKQKKRKRHILKKLLGTAFLCLLLAVGGGAIYIYARFDTTADAGLFQQHITDATTRFYYCDTGIDHHYDPDRVVALEETLKGTRHILFAEYQEMPKALIDAFVAIEDKRFYEHEGVDLYRSIAAAANYILGFDDRFGASTITQQLIKNVTGKNEITVARKLQEVLYAYDLERKLTKEEILESYLNVINLSEGCYGVGAAADIYFSKSVSELTLLECVALAAITNSPTYYDPIRNPENNKARRELILDAMLEEGYISQEQYNQNIDAELVFNINHKALETRVNSWYIDMVVEDVTRDLAAAYGYSREQASELVYNGGLRIVTAMDPVVQQALEKYYKNTYHFGRQGGETAQSAMILIHPTSGDILGVVGAVGQKTGNRVQSYATDAKRPSGSTIKPLSVYAPALEDGRITYATVYDDVPVKFVATAAGYKPWPNNANMVYRGLTNVNFALAHSLNTVALRVLEDIGLDRSFSFVRDTLGVQSLVAGERVEGVGYLTDKAPAALALGQMNHGVTLREMTAAYTIFTDAGKYNAPRSYYKVYDAEGRELLSCEEKENYAISSPNATVMTRMLENVIATGTAKTVTLDSFIDVAGKTGTTQNNCDKWFIAYTPYCLAGVWYGYEYPKPIAEHEKYQYLTIWNDVMTELHQSYYVPAGGLRRFDRDPLVVRATFCRDSGRCMSTDCYLDPRHNRAEEGYFVKGTEPHGYCTSHEGVMYNTETGGVVCEDCTCESVERVGLLRVKRRFPKEIYVTDAQYTCRDMPPGAPICSEANRPYFYQLQGPYSYSGLSPGEVQYNRACTHQKESEGEDETGNDPELE